uniref:C-type natriuretic peptide n=1 Tax=Gopherus evgoodei TaxID=1825980 RepID=A0A8C4YAF7_9SAUR
MQPSSTLLIILLLPQLASPASLRHPKVGTGLGREPRSPGSQPPCSDPPAPTPLPEPGREPRSPGSQAGERTQESWLPPPFSADVPAPPRPRGPLAGSRTQRDSPEPPSLDPAWARFFADFMSWQRKFWGRTRKAPTLQGCFGMKLDRIGTRSGLGC